MLEERIRIWLQRQTLARNTNYLVPFSALISTDIGASRSENQDRAIATVLPSDHLAFPGAGVFILCDGMGGMRDGGICASIAIAAFATSMLQTYAQSAERALTDAAIAANEAVYRFGEGRGGTTLSVLFVTRDNKLFLLNVGDSRIYAFGNGRGVERLTTDDTLAEAVGGTGRELIQFVGMGEGMQPHVRMSNSTHKRIAITSDGVHYINPEAFAAIAEHAPSIRTFAERVSAAARWCGSPDNATLMAIEIGDKSNNFGEISPGVAVFFDSFSSLEIVPSKEQRLYPTTPPRRERKNQTSAPESVALKPSNDANPEPKKRRRKATKTRGPDKGASVQYEIAVDMPKQNPSDDADR